MRNENSRLWLFGAVAGTAGNYDSQIFEGAVNVPMGERLALRIAARVAKHDGYTPGPYAGKAFDDEDGQAWRATLRWTPTDNFTNNLVVNGYEARETGAGFRLTGVLPGSTFATRAPQTPHLPADRRRPAAYG